MNIKVKYLVDEKGLKTGVFFDILHYKHLVEYVEDMEDALALKRAIKNDRSKGMVLSEWKKQIN